MTRPAAKPGPRPRPRFAWFILLIDPTRLGAQHRMVPKEYLHQATTFHGHRARPFPTESACLRWIGRRRARLEAGKPADQLAGYSLRPVRMSRCEFARARRRPGPGPA